MFIARKRRGESFFFTFCKERPPGGHEYNFIRSSVKIFCRFFLIPHFYDCHMIPTSTPYLYTDPNNAIPFMELQALFNYRTRAIISRGLYIFYPIFKGNFFVLRRFFQKILSLCMACIQERLVIKSGL